MLVYEILSNLKLELATNTIKKLCRKKFELAENCFIHSDQGVHYTSPRFQNLLKQKGIKQSMSGRGNRWDNAPMESFWSYERSFRIKKMKKFKKSKKRNEKIYGLLQQP